MAKKNEKRQHPRVEARLALQLAEESLGEALVTTESLNISRGGVYCESPEYLAPLSRVALTVVLPIFGAAARPRMLRSEGVVVRCEPMPALRGRKRYQLACCFTGLDGETRQLLDEFVSWRAIRGRAAALAALRGAAAAAKGRGKVARKKVVKKVARAKAAAKPRTAVKKSVAKKRSAGTTSRAKK